MGISNSRGISFGILAAGALLALPLATRADIFRWDNGKPIPGSAGIILAPGVNLSDWNTGKKNLLKAGFAAADLSNANFSDSNLSKSRFGLRSQGGNTPVDLAGANFTGANIAGADFRLAQHVTAAQIASTQTFNKNKLSGLMLDDADLTSIDLNHKNLRSTDFEFCTLTSATFSGANISRANFTGAEGFTAGQLASTRNFTHHNISGINFTDVDISGINLTKVNLSKTLLTDADLSGATFTKANLTKTNLNDADLRGATGITLKKNTLTHDTIQSDGSINGLALGNGETLTIRNNATAVTAKTTATFGAGSTIAFSLQDNWTSPMDFANGINPTLGGTIDLDVAPGVDPSTLAGHTFQIFNWNSAPTGGNQFASIVTDPSIVWDTTNLYVNGTVTAVSFVGNPAPEPASLGIMAAASLLLLRRRRRA